MVLPRLQGAAETAVSDFVLALLLPDTSMAVADDVVDVDDAAWSVLSSPLLSWKTDVDLTVWPELSPERTNPLLQPPTVGDEVVVVIVVCCCCCCVILLVVLDRSPPVGSVTLDVCIMGDGSTSIDSFRGIDVDEEPVPPTLTSWTLLYWIVL